MSSIEALPILDPSTTIGEGGFGKIFPDPRDSDLCIKVLNSALTGDQASELLRLIEVQKWACPSDVATMRSRFAWPVEAFGSAGSITGFTMPRAPKSTRFELTTIVNSEETDFQAQFLMDDQYWRGRAIRTPKPDVSLHDRIEILIDLCNSISVLHRAGLCFSDISSKNIAIRAEQVPGVFFYDADSILTVSERSLAGPVNTPGWEVSEHLGPLEIDRAKIGLFGIRLFLENPKAAGADDDHSELASLLGPSISKSLVELASTGDESLFGDVAQGLRSRRSSERARQAFDSAVSSGFARWVMRESPHAENAADLRCLREAEDQFVWETAVAGLAGARRRKALRSRPSLQRSGFTPDIAPLPSLPNAPNSEADLKNLVYDALFEEIASHLVSEGLGKFESHGWVEPAVHRAMVEAEPPQLQVTGTPGKAMVRVWWPVEPFVNRMSLEIRHPGGVAQVELFRGDLMAEAVREVVLSSGGTIHVTVTAGSESPLGMKIWSPEECRVETTFTVQPVERPAVTPPLDRMPEISSVVVDPEVERQRRLIERLEHEKAVAETQRRLRRKMFAYAAGGILLVGSSLLGWRFLRESPIPPLVTPAFEPVAPSDLVLSAGGTRLSLTWDPGMNADGVEPDTDVLVRSQGDIDQLQVLQPGEFEVVAPRGGPLRLAVVGDLGNGYSPVLKAAAHVEYTPEAVISGTISKQALRVEITEEEILLKSELDELGLYVVDSIVITDPHGEETTYLAPTTRYTILPIDSAGHWNVIVRVRRTTWSQEPIDISLPTVIVPINSALLTEPQN